MVDWIAGASIVGSVHGATALLHIALPFPSPTTGYACDCNGDPLTYKLNGIYVMLSILGLWVLLCSQGIFQADYIYQHIVDAAVVAFIAGISGSLALYIFTENEPYSRCSTRDRPVPPKATSRDLQILQKRSQLAHFFLGRAFNPRLYGIDLKMYGYMVGDIMLLLNIWSGASRHLLVDGSLSNAVLVYSVCMTFFCIEYLHWEEPHLYTYDLFAEKMGFKLWWGCMVFYPFFYCIGMWGGGLAEQKDVDISSLQMTGIVLLYFFGWTLTRGANMQKYYSKKQPTASYCTLGFFVRVSQTKIPGTRLLCGGFWGLARHINYLGEIMQSLAVSLPGILVSGSWLPLSYVLYYLLLFLPRQRDDEVICQQKYGAKWDEYVERVPYRMIPFIY
jgi:delta14-sterol reductase